MKKRIKWYNIIPKPIQRIQARYFTFRDRFIDIDYEFDKTKQINKQLTKKELYETKQSNPSKTLSYILVIFIIIIIFIYIVPDLLI